MSLIDSRVLTWGTVVKEDATYNLVCALEDQFRDEASGGSLLLGTAISALTSQAGILGLIIPTVFSILFNNTQNAKDCEKIQAYMYHNDLATIDDLKLQLDIVYHSVTKEIKEVNLMDIDHPCL